MHNFVLIAVFQAHQWVLDNMDKWFEKYLIADNSLRIRNGKFETQKYHLTPSTAYFRAPIRLFQKKG